MSDDDITSSTELDLATLITMPITAADVEQGYMKTKKKLEERNKQKLKQEKKAKKAAKKKGRDMPEFFSFMHRSDTFVHAIQFYPLYFIHTFILTC